MKSLVPAIFAAILGFSSNARGDETFRCGQWLVSSELSVADLLTKCGEPAQRATSSEDVRVRNRNNGLMVTVGVTETQTWTYDRGKQAPRMVVTIVDGRIKSIVRAK